MAYIRAWMSTKFGQIRLGTTDLAALEHKKIDYVLKPLHPGSLLATDRSKAVVLVQFLLNVLE